MTKQRYLLVPAAIVIAGAIIAAAILYVGGFGNRAVPNTALSNEAVGTGAADLTDDDPSLGNPEAPVTIVEFGDYQCPFCGRFFRQTEPQIIERYVKTDKVRFVYRDFAILGEESVRSAEAAECADEQGQFWSYHDRLYAYLWDNYYAQNRNGENVGAFSPENLERFAAELNLDSVKFGVCLTSGRYRPEVEGDTSDGRTAGVDATPTLFINARMVRGALPFEQFVPLIEEALGTD